MQTEQFKFHHPFTAIVSGCTGSGKSIWVLRLIESLGQMVTPPPIGVLYCYGELNANVLRMQQFGSARENRVMENEEGNEGARKRPWIRAYNGVPDEAMVQAEASATGGRLLLVLDDLVVGMGASFLDNLFTRGSHHWGVSVILVTQHLFTKELRIARNNSHYIVLLRNPTGALQVRNLATQLFPNQAKFFAEVYRDATAENFSYLLIDMHPGTKDALRLKTHIYPGEHTIFYLPKGKSN
jgi:hypothetical protein